MPRKPKPKHSSLQSPITVKQLVECLRSDLSAEAHYLIGRLAEKRLTIYEVIAELIKQGFRKSRVKEQRLIKQLHDTRYKKLRYKKMQRHGKVFGFWHGEWYIIGSITDPSVVPPIKTACLVFPSNISEFRSAAQDILENSGPLTLGQIVEGIIKHPAYHGEKRNKRTVTVGVDNALRRNKWLFEKKKDQRGKIPRRFARWGIATDIQPPKKRVPQKDLLYAAMVAKNVIRGWKIDELVALVKDPALGFGYCQTASRDCVKAFLIGKLRAEGETRYQRLGRGQTLRYRARPAIVRQKVPQSQNDWDMLTRRIFIDLGGGDFEEIVAAVGTYGYLFGWDTTLLPNDFMANNIARSLAKIYANLA